MAEDPNWAEIARNNVEAHLEIDGIEDMDETEAAEAIYEAAYILAVDAIVDAGHPNRKEAHDIAASVARSFAQP